MTREELINELKELRNQLMEYRTADNEQEESHDVLQWFKIFSDNAYDLVYFCDTMGNILYVNRIFEKMTGYKPEDFTGKPFAKLFDETNLKRGMDAYVKTIKGESPEYEVIFRDTGVMCEYKNFPFRNKEGEVVGVVGIARDVTDRRKKAEELEQYREHLEELAEMRSAELKNKIEDYQRSEDALRQSEARFRTLIETSPHGIQENDTNGIITFSNKAHGSILGYSKGELEGTAIWNLCSTEEEKENVRNYLKILVREQPAPVPYIGENITKDGRIIQVQVDWNYKRDDRGNLTGFISVITDITARKNAEAAKEKMQLQLLHSQKMEAIGRLAGGISHDFGNILTAIKNFSALGIKRKVDCDPEVQNIFEHIRTASVRAINLTRQLTTFGQKGFTRIVNANINKVINDLLHMLNRLISENITISVDLAPGLWKIRGDTGMLEQVVTNLVINARDAIAGVGIISIQSRNVIKYEDACKKNPYERAGRFVCLTVKDTGAGIPEENLNHIFEPFFTTKKTGSSGLGLSVVYGIIKDHQGWINVSSETGNGTAFEIYLPAIEEEADEHAEDRIKVSKLRCCGEKILLVEDEVLVRTSTRMTLIDEGYVVFEAESAESALNIFHRENGKFDLVMSDLVLPGKDGLTLIKELIGLNTGLKAILNSGYIDKPIDRSDIEKYGIVFFNKPYDMQEVLVAIRNLLQQS